jgi:hypothetical protein
MFSSNKKKPEFVTNAIVEISENSTQWKPLIFDDRLKHYIMPQLFFPIEEGKTYYIRASAPGHETVTSSCTVPYLRETNLSLVVKESINCVHNQETYSWYHNHYYFEWNDYPGEENYYIINKNHAYWHYYFDNLNENGYPIFDSIRFHSWYYFVNDNHKPCIFSDIGCDGEKMSVFLSVFRSSTDDFSKMALLQTDRNCYLFEQSLIDYNRDFQIFMLEPNQIFTNIRNGYGVFGAFVMKEYSFDLEEK